MSQAAFWFYLLFVPVAFLDLNGFFFISVHFTLIFEMLLLNTELILQRLK